MDKAALINTQVRRLIADCKLQPITASEIEFYLYGSDKRDLTPLWDAVEERCQQNSIGIYNIEKERGREQHEIALVPTLPAKTAHDTELLKTIVTEIAAQHKFTADFSAKPLPNEPGSGLHIHVHLADATGMNVFYKDDDNISEELLFSIGGLLEWLPASMPIFAPEEKSYARFAQAEVHTPTTLSWGANNRTVAIRLPDKPRDNKHIEHRVSGADADPAKVIAVILAAMHWGIKNQSEPGPQMFGDAALEMYDLPKLPLTLAEAKTAMQISTLMAGYFDAGELS